MASAVVAGRVDEQVKLAVDAVLRVAGSTASDVIAGLWNHIAATGVLPDYSEGESSSGREKDLEEFISFVDDLPPAPEWLVSMDRDAMRDMIATRYV